MQSMRRQFVLPCCSAMFGPDVVPLHHRYYFPQDRAWRVSISKDSGAYAVDKKTICPTVLFCNAWPRCCAPSSPILFSARSSVVSVYIEGQWWICSRWEDNLSYRVVLQCVTQILCPFITDIIFRKIECGECLYRRIVVNMQSIRRQFVLPCFSSMLGPDVVLLQHEYYCR
jgi:hypothetical protein